MEYLLTILILGEELIKPVLRTVILWLLFFKLKLNNEEQKARSTSRRRLFA